MKRSSTIKRKKELRRRRRVALRSGKRSKYAQRVRAVGYMLSVKQLPCAALIVPGHVCDGPIEADHAGPRGTRRKAHDSTAIPLCKLGHQQRGDFAGPFRSWDQQRMRDFLIGRVLQTQRYLAARGIQPPPTTEAEAIEIARWMGLRTADEITTTGEPPATVTGAVAVHIGGRSKVAELENANLATITATVNKLAEDLREVGNVDVRHPEGASNR